MVVLRYLFLVAAVLSGTVARGFDPSQQDDSLALVRHFKVPERPLEMPDGIGLMGNNDGLTVSLMGGTDVFRMQESGFLETMLQKAFPDRKIRVRNLGWSGDTVYRQQRPMFFYTEKGDNREGSVPDSREKVEPGIFVLSFGKTESLDGLNQLAEFEVAFDQLLGELQRFSKRILIVEPVPFSEFGPAKSLALERNRVLGQYVEVIKSVAKQRKAPMTFLAWAPDSNQLSREVFLDSGIHLSEEGQRRWAIQVVAAFGTGIAYAPGGVEEEGSVFAGGLRQAILEKNRLWDQYYRPTNWAFLFGDRQHVPSSRDHRDSDRRWFVEELNGIPALIAEKEEEIWEEAKRVEP